MQNSKKINCAVAFWAHYYVVAPLRVIPQFSSHRIALTVNPPRQIIQILLYVLM